MKKQLFILTLLFFTTISFTFAQDEEPENLVKNSGFMIKKGKVKGPGMITATSTWSSPTEDPADFFTKFAKEPYISSENLYGAQDPEEGTGYAGVQLYHAKDKGNRTFIQTELAYEMNADEMYCIKYFVSLADLSKFACNDIGAYVSTEKVNQKKILSYEIEPQIKHSANKIFNEYALWEPICQIYKAKGGEKYLTLGNFTKPGTTKFEKIKRPKGFSSPQVGMAYYYIDQVTVIPMSNLEEGECSCEKQGGSSKMNVVYRSNVSETAELELEQAVKLSTIVFEEESIELSATSKASIDKLVNLMKKNPKLRIEIMGHSSSIEEVKVPDDISTKRANEVHKYMVSMGIPAERLEFVGFKDTKPTSQDSSATGQVKNRRVNFRILK